MPSLFWGFCSFWETAMCFDLQCHSYTLASVSRSSPPPLHAGFTFCMQLYTPPDCIVQISKVSQSLCQFCTDKSPDDDKSSGNFLLFSDGRYHHLSRQSPSCTRIHTRSSDRIREICQGSTKSYRGSRQGSLADGV